MKAMQRVKAVLRTTKLEHYISGLILGLTTSYVQASILAPVICKGFKTLAGNDLYSIAAGVGGAGLLIANAMDEGDNKLKTGALRIAGVTAVAINLESITTMVTGTPWGC
ncbi:hypothetical protein Dsui_2578 [Azospira oryzae PS]|jgi:hypothetical protein|uniref:Uncharacterized protein n=1 Tax=Azospira oryzae (strain ATCC BAA-33 / DSM 13638 / PS) TaxID=640081 RepID=G8QNN5_AZOOP|nr:hypothetical protein [Azospira oryzae]AEV26929.1 hypothetical protein Dsui_2578 [Azospira oryzae PS]